MPVSCCPSLSTLWQPPWVDPLLGTGPEHGAQQQTMGHFGCLPKRLVTLRNSFREEIWKTVMENSWSDNTRSEFILKKKKAATEKGKQNPVFADFLRSRSPRTHVPQTEQQQHKHCASQTRAKAWQLLGHSEQKGKADSGTLSTRTCPMGSKTSLKEEELGSWLCY